MKSNCFSQPSPPQKLHRPGFSLQLKHFRGSPFPVPLQSGHAPSSFLPMPLQDMQSLALRFPVVERWRRPVAGTIAALIVLGYLSVPAAVLAGWLTESP